MPVIEVHHPLVKHKIGLLREATISTKAFRELTNELSRLHYLDHFVGNLAERTALIVDPMLATGGSMITTAKLLTERGCTDIRALVLVAAPEGIRALDAQFPALRCWAAAVDSHLNEVGYIIPGLGDAGDKIFGTK